MEAIENLEQATTLFPNGCGRHCADPSCNALIAMGLPAARCPLCVVVEAYRLAQQRDRRRANAEEWAATHGSRRDR